MLQFLIHVAFISNIVKLHFAANSHCFVMNELQLTKVLQDQFQRKQGMNKCREGTINFKTYSSLLNLM